MQNKYAVDPRHKEGKIDIVQYVTNLFQRVSEGDVALRVGHTAIEDGNLTVRNGDIIVSESDDTVVLRIKHGAVPEILFFPLGENTTHQGTLFGQDWDNNPSDPNIAVQLGIELLNHTIDGGKVLLMHDGTVLAHQPNGGQESFIWLNSLAGITEEVFAVRGRWPDQLQYDDHAGLLQGAFTATSGFSTWTYTYVTPFATSFIPLCTVGINGGTVTWGLDSYSTSNFVIRFGSTGSNKMVTFWNFRI
jgi:hypothetical protein